MIFKDGIPSGIAVPDLALALADEVENQALGAQALDPWPASRTTTDD